MGRGPERFGTIVTLLATTTLLAAAACDSSSRPAPNPAESATTSGPVRGATAPDGGTIRVAEQGFTAGTTRTGRPIVSIGFVLQNTSRKWTARDTVMRVSRATATGQSVTDYTISPIWRVGSILVPGQRAGVGWNGRVDLAGTVKVSIRFSTTAWTPAATKLPVNGESLAPAPLTADAVSTKRDPGGSGFQATVSFTVHSGYPVVLHKVWTDVIYRDAAGGIVGGTNTRLTGRSLITSCPPGSSQGRMVDESGPPAGADLARTGVYLYPDPG